MNFLGPLVSAGAGLLSNFGSAPKQTPIQKKQLNLVDQLLASINGQGPYSDLFNSNEEAFQRSFVQPAQARFRNQIAPQIQQSYIAHGQQRGTGLDDQLLRAGVDLNSQLDQYAYQFGQDAMNRKQNAITGILSQGAGAANETSPFQDAMTGLAAYTGSSDFGDQIKDFFKNQSPTWGSRPTVGGGQIRKGYAS